MWYPNKHQWWVIWIAAIIAFWVLATGDTNSNTQPFVIAFGIVGLGLLLVWQLSRKGKS